MVPTPDSMLRLVGLVCDSTQRLSFDEDAVKKLSVTLSELCDFKEQASEFVLMNRIVQGASGVRNHSIQRSFFSTHRAAFRFVSFGELRAVPSSYSLDKLRAEIIRLAPP